MFPMAEAQNETYLQKHKQTRFHGYWVVPQLGTITHNYLLVEMWYAHCSARQRGGGAGLLASESQARPQQTVLDVIRELSYTNNVFSIDQSIQIINLYIYTSCQAQQAWDRD